MVMMRYIFAFLLIGYGSWAMAQTAQENFDAGKAAYENGQYEEALKKFNKAIKQSPKEMTYYQWRGDVKMRLDDPKSAISDYNKAERLGVKEASLYSRRGAANLAMNRINMSITDFDKAIALSDSDANTYFNRGLALYLQMELDGAIKDFKKAIDLKDDFWDAYYFMGIAKGEREAGRDDGTNDIKRAMAMDSTLKDGNLSIGIIKYYRKQYEEALIYLDQAVDVPGEMQATAYWYRAETKFALEQKDQACEDYLAAGNLGDEEAAATHIDVCIRGQEKPASRRRGNREVITF